MRNPLIFGEPCRDRTDNLLIKSYALFVIHYINHVFTNRFSDALRLETLTCGLLCEISKKVKGNFNRKEIFYDGTRIC
jgi:hypothetical protein